MKLVGEAGPRQAVKASVAPGAAEESAASIRMLMAVLVAAIFLSVLTASMLNVMLPLIRAEFGASSAEIGWVITGFSLAYAIGVPLYGRMSDIYGVRRVYVFGLLGFAGGGLLCALAPNLPVLVAGRVIQGAGGAVVPALASVTVARVLPPGQRGGAMGLVASSVGIGGTAGPIAGGVFGDAFGWRVLFVGTVALMLLLVPLAWRVLPGERATLGERFDLPGGILLGLAAGLFLFGITRAQAEGLDSAIPLGSFAAAAIAGVAFAWRINAAPAPFVKPALFANRAYSTLMVTGFFVSFAYIVTIVFVPLMLVQADGLSASQAGLVLAPGAITQAALSPLAGRLSDRAGARAPVVAGIAVMAASMTFLSMIAGAPAPMIALGVVVLSAGFAGVQSPINNAAANTLRQEDVGGGMGLFSGAFFLGSGTGPAIAGAVLAAREGVAGGALNPLHLSDAPAYSDTFLVVLPALMIALAFATRIAPGGR